MTEGKDRLYQNSKPRFFYGYIVVLASFCIMIAFVMARLSFGIFFKPMATELGWSSATMSSAFSLSLLIEGLQGIVMGRLTDRLGPRILLTSCGILVGLGYLLMSRVNAVWQMYLVYGVVIGMGTGGVVVPLVTSVARWFVDRRSMMTGIVLTGASLGSLLIPPLADWLISTYQWRLSYVILSGIISIIFLLAAQFVRRDPAQVGQIPYSKPVSREQEIKPDTRSLSFNEAIYTRQLWLAFSMCFFFGCCGYSVMVHIVPHIIELGISASTAANVLATIGGANIVGRILLGVIADRIGNRRVLIIRESLIKSSFMRYNRNKKSHGGR